MVQKSYFDCGKAGDLITVATVFGTAAQWDNFDNAWKQVFLSENPNFLHTTDAIALQGDYSKQKGWNDDRVDDLISKCVNVIENCIAIPSPLPGIVERHGLCAVTLSISIQDYKRARNVQPKLPNSIYEIFASETLGFAFKWGKFIGAKWHHLYFDQGEPLYGHIHDRKKIKKASRDIPLLRKVAHFGEANMRFTPALQMADLFAWCIAHNDRVVRSWHGRLHSLPWSSRNLPYEMLLTPMKGALEKTAAWGMPTRRMLPPN